MSEIHFSLELVSLLVLHIKEAVDFQSKGLGEETELLLKAESGTLNWEECLQSGRKGQISTPWLAQEKSQIEYNGLI